METICVVSAVAIFGLPLLAFVFFYTAKRNAAERAKDPAAPPATDAKERLLPPDVL